MHKVVATIPMDPGHAKKPGFYSIFMFADAVADAYGLPLVCGLNTLGKQTASNDTLEQLRDTLTLLNIRPYGWWADSMLNDILAQNTFDALLAAGCIRTTTRDICRCSCGNVEHLAGIELFSTKTLIKEGRSLCCHTRITESREEVLTTLPLPDIPLPTVYPKWAEREFRTKMAKLAGSELLLSRTTPRRYRIVQGSRSWYIDNDAVWWLYMRWLYASAYQPTHLVVGVSTLRQAAVICTISALLGLPVPTHVYCLPKVFFAPIHGTTSLESAIARFGIDRVRNALLWSALSQRKEYTLSGSLFPAMRNAPVEKQYALERSYLRR